MPTNADPDCAALLKGGAIREVPIRAPMDMPHERRAAVLEAEARRLAHVVTRYGVLTRHQLAELSGARHWARGRFLRALELAEERGLIRHLGCSLYATASACRSQLGTSAESRAAPSKARDRSAVNGGPEPRSIPAHE